MNTLAIVLGAVGAVLAVALGVGIYLVIRGEYLRLPADPGGEMDALTRLLASFARFSIRSRRIIRFLAVALVLDFILSAGFGFLAVEFQQQRCVPYTQISKTNAGIRRFVRFTLRPATRSTDPARRTQALLLESELRRDFPNVPCP